MSLRFGYAELCLPAEDIRAAVGDLAASPLYELLQAHVLQLYRFLDQDIAPSAAESLGAATLELARAVIATVGQDDLTRNEIHRPDLGEGLVGSGYRSEIFYTSDEQRQAAEDTIAAADDSGMWPGTVVTKISQAGPFWAAEAEDQDYLQRYSDRNNQFSTYRSAAR